MRFFDVFKGKKDANWEEENAYKGDTPDCPNCGSPMTKKYVFSEIYCSNCRYGLEDNETDYENESLNIYDAADIWASNGKDEDYTFGYSVEELEDAFNQD